MSTVKYLPGWLAGPLRACFSQTFGIIKFCGTLVALMMLSASAVADSHPWQRRMRYILGVVVFATAIAATHVHTHILPKLQHHATSIRSLEHLNVCPTRSRCHQALFWKSSVSGSPGPTPPTVRSHVSVMLSRGSCSISIRGHLVPGPDLPVECVSRVHAVKREL